MIETWNEYLTGCLFVFVENKIELRNEIIKLVFLTQEKLGKKSETFLKKFVLNPVT